MKRSYLAILLIVYICNVYNMATPLNGPYCFHFTWSSSKITTENCTNNVPCVEPIHSDSKLNTTEIWENWIKEAELENSAYSKYFCKMKPDNVCIKYTYIYNNAVVNVSHFCGKVIQDRTSAITSGCYAQRIEGYTVEACACQSRNKSIPCNATIKNANSISIIIVTTTISLFIYKIFYIH